MKPGPGASVRSGVLQLSSCCLKGHAPENGIPSHHPARSPETRRGSPESSPVQTGQLQAGGASSLQPERRLCALHHLCYCLCHPHTGAFCTALLPGPLCSSGLHLLLSGCPRVQESSSQGSVPLLLEPSSLQPAGPAHTGSTPASVPGNPCAYPCQCPVQPYLLSPSACGEASQHYPESF